ncbi:hypothetical protein PGTUg99_025916 [Puccinia graminis f. sp. tritici]|uniref:Uncharacterized protein n=1 Tax=Puccinia graminis f. sp. tritici TaxID=56615 RepID=A0A5B0RJV3_PUCGR|nr:hypothetical protein PGTUg99_025916 [Puccinia graminis f. sp. tritici]
MVWCIPPGMAALTQSPRGKLLFDGGHLCTTPAPDHPKWHTIPTVRDWVRGPVQPARLVSGATCNISTENNMAKHKH